MLVSALFFAEQVNKPRRSHDELYEREIRFGVLVLLVLSVLLVLLVLLVVWVLWVLLVLVE